MTVTINVDINSVAVMGSLEAMPKLLDLEALKAMETSTFIVEAEVKALTPRKTGRLFSAWESRVNILGDLTGIVANKVEYAGYVEEGTTAHDIVAHGNALVFTVAGKKMFRKRVRHPGFAGRHMARLGAAAARPAVMRVFRDAIKDAIRLALGK